MTTLSPVRTVERVTPIVTLLLIFLSGAVAGAVVMSFIHHGVHPPFVTVPTGLSMSVDEWKRKLDLTDDQARQLISTLDDFSTYYDNVLSDGNTRIMQLLNDAQKKKFIEIVQAHKPK